MFMEFFFVILLLPLLVSFVMSAYFFLQYIRFKSFEQQDFLAYRIVWLDEDDLVDDESEVRYVVLGKTSESDSSLLSSPEIERKFLTDFEKSSFDKIMKQLDPYD